MGINDFIAWFVATIGGVGVIFLGVTAYIGKIASSKIIEQNKIKLMESLEGLKSELLRESSKEIEALRYEFQILNSQFSTEHSILFKKRIEILDFIFSRLIEINCQASEALHFLSAPRDPSGIRSQSQKIYDDIQWLWEYLSKNSIYLESELCKTIDSVLYKASESITTYLCMQGNYDDHELHTISDERDRAWESVKENLHPAIKEIEDVFRNIFLQYQITANKRVN